MKMQDKWTSWAVELQSIGQSGLAYTDNVFDIGRYNRIREIAAEMVAEGTDMPIEKVKDVFLFETGYQTPKLDCRGALFSGDKILLVQERDGRWALPGGWVDVYDSAKEGVEREVWEEAGLTAVAESVIAVQDWKKRNVHHTLFGITKVFFLCRATGGEFKQNEETLASGYFALDELPTLADTKTTREQIEMCFEAYRAGDSWKVVFD